jgi:predicted NAD/FAD-dependent oxidoreductase
MDGIVKPWQGKVKVVKSGQLLDEKKVTERWVGVPAMDAVAAHLAAGIEIDYNVAVLSLTKSKNRWQLTNCNQDTYGPYEAVIIATPPPQAAGLLESCSKLRDCIRKVKMQPCLAVMAAFDKPLDLPFDAAFVHESPVRWAARNSSKPSRPAAECWVFHADAKWSHEQAGVDNAAGVRSLIDPFFKSMGQTPDDPIFHQTRYWKTAAAANPLNVGCLWDAALKIGLCGDWCQMSRFEGAALSGMAMAGRILNMNTGVPYKLQDLNA